MDAEDEQARLLGARIRDEGRYHPAPPGLAARMLAALPADAAQPRAAVRRTPWMLASAMAGACVLVLGIAVVALRPAADRPLAEEIVASHVRSLMVDHAADVASSDHHTVKPWFAGKLDFSPPVSDLTAQGFALLGGRLDYVDHRPVAALVYRHRQHLINLFVWPASGEGAAVQQELQGFHLLHWRHAGMAYWAVSDLNPEELAQFRETLQKTPG